MMKSLSGSIKYLFLSIRFFKFENEIMPIDHVIIIWSTIFYQDVNFFTDLAYVKFSYRIPKLQVCDITCIVRISWTENLL